MIENFAGDSMFVKRAACIRRPPPQTLLFSASFECLEPSNPLATRAKSFTDQVRGRSIWRSKRLMPAFPAVFARPLMLRLLGCPYLCCFAGDRPRRARAGHHPRHVRGGPAPGQRLALLCAAAPRRRCVVAWVLGCWGGGGLIGGKGALVFPPVIDSTGLAFLHRGRRLSRSRHRMYPVTLQPTSPPPNPPSPCPRPAADPHSEFDAKLAYLLAMYDTMTVGKTMIFVSVRVDSGLSVWGGVTGRARDVCNPYPLPPPTSFCTRMRTPRHHSAQTRAGANTLAQAMRAQGHKPSVITGAYRGICMGGRGDCARPPACLFLSHRVHCSPVHRSPRYLMHTTRPVLPFPISLCPPRLRPLPQAPRRWPWMSACGCRRSLRRA